MLILNTGEPPEAAQDVCFVSGPLATTSRPRRESSEVVRVLLVTTKTMRAIIQRVTRATVTGKRLHCMSRAAMLWRLSQYRWPRILANLAGLALAVPVKGKEASGTARRVSHRSPLRPPLLVFLSSEATSEGYEVMTVSRGRPWYWQLNDSPDCWFLSPHTLMSFSVSPVSLSCLSLNSSSLTQTVPLFLQWEKSRSVQ